MNKLKEIVYKLRLWKIGNKLTENAEKIRDYCGIDKFDPDKFKDDFKYNRLRLEQLRLMSCRSYLENKLTYVGNKNAD